MKRSLIPSVIAFGGLAGCAQNIGETAARTPWELLALLLVSVIVFGALTGLLAWLSRRTPQTGDWLDLPSRSVRSRRTHTHRHRGRLVPSSRRPDRGIDPGASAADSVLHPPAP